MAAQINYEDNLYCLAMSLKNIRISLGLEVDRELFLQKVVNDIIFYDSVLQKLYQSLIQNTFLIRRLELLRLVLLAKKDFIQFLDDINTIDSSFAKDLDAFSNQLLQCRERNNENIHDIQSLLLGPDQGNQQSEDLITSDEYKYLFQQDPEQSLL